MAVASLSGTGDGVAQAVWRDAVAPALHSYSQILFVRSWLVGGALLLATALAPRVAMVGLGAVLVALVVAKLLHFETDARRAGLYSYNALLVGLGGGALLGGSLAALMLVGLAAAASVVATGAMQSAIGRGAGLPVLSVPFLLVFYLVMGAVPALGLSFMPLSTAGAVEFPAWVPAVFARYLDSLGAIFFLPRLDVGVVMFAGLVLFSRIGALLSLLAFALVYTIASGTLADPGDPVMAIVLGYNVSLTAIALGGIWFVPSMSSFVLALSAAVLCGLVAIGSAPAMHGLGLPLLILPFNATVLMVLYAMRQRTRDATPKAVDFVPGTPEANLNYNRTRVARFGRHYAVRLRAPFLGSWVCTQSVDGAETHRGPWRHALDFEVQAADGKTHRGRGRLASDYLCHRLAVNAPAAGTVVKVVDGIADNPIGEMNLRDNWGNLVMMYHAPGLYSLVAHLASGSVAVREGQQVPVGTTLGLCGNSGRSPAPHLHFQLQATARIGAPTLSVELHDVVVVDEGPERMVGTIVPDKGMVLRNLQPDPDIAAMLRIPLRSELRFRVHSGTRAYDDTVVADVGLLGNLFLTSGQHSGRMFYDVDDQLFTVFDSIGPRRAAARLIHLALARVPFELGRGTLTWDDSLPSRYFVPLILRPPIDLVSPFRPGDGVAMTYKATRNAGGIAITGTSHATWRGQPLAQTSASIDRDGIAAISVRLRGRECSLERRSDEDGASGHASVERSITAEHRET